MLVLEVSAPVGEYRPGDTVWLKKTNAWAAKDKDFLAAMNRDCLVPRPGDRLAFGRLIDRNGPMVAILPAQPGQKQLVIDNPEWIAVVSMLVRPL